MPRNCSICSNERTADLSKAIARGDSNRQIAGQFGVTASAVQRHRVNCLRAPRKHKADDSNVGKPTVVPGAESASGSVRFDSKDPSSLVSATARLVDEALGLLEHAKKGDDRKTALAALREARDGLQLLMRVEGMLKDGAGTNIDARRQTVQIFAKLSEDELKALAYGTAIPADSAASGAVEVVGVTQTAPSDESALETPEKRCA